MRRLSFILLFSLAGRLEHTRIADAAHSGRAAAQNPRQIVKRLFILASALAANTAFPCAPDTPAPCARETGAIAALQCSAIAQLPGGTRDYAPEGRATLIFQNLAGEAESCQEAGGGEFSPEAPTDIPPAEWAESVQSCPDACKSARHNRTKRENADISPAVRDGTFGGELSDWLPFKDGSGDTITASFSIYEDARRADAERYAGFAPPKLQKNP